MSTQLTFGSDARGYNSFAAMPSTNIFSAKLTVGAAASITLPTNHKLWFVAFSFSGGSEVWVDFTGATAASPTLNTFGSTTSCRNPGTRFVKAFKADGTTAATISLITPDATAYVSIELWSAD